MIVPAQGGFGPVCAADGRGSVRGGTRPDQPADRGADAKPAVVAIGFGGVGRVAVAAHSHPADGLVGIEAPGDQVAVAREAVPEHRRGLQAGLPGPQQHLGRAQGPGGQHHPVGLHPTTHRWLAGVGHHDRPAVGGRFDVGHRARCKHLGAARAGSMKVVAVVAALGPDVAAGDAITASVACRHLEAGRVGAITKGHVQRSTLGAGVDPPGAGHRLESAQLGRGAVGRQGCGTRQVTHPADVIGPPGVVAQLGRPAPVVHHLGIGHHRHRGVDQRCAAHAAAGEDHHVVEHPQVEEGVSRADAEAVAPQLAVGDQLARGFGKRPWSVFRAALEHRHPQPSAGQSIAQHRSRRTAADDDHVVALFQPSGTAVDRGGFIGGIDDLIIQPPSRPDPLC